MKKKCPSCSTVKEDTDFYANSVKKDKLSSCCRDCQIGFAKDWHKRTWPSLSEEEKEKSRKRVREYKRKMRIVLREHVNAYKELVGCQLCGHQTTAALDMHHVEEKRFTISKAVSQVTTIHNLEMEINRCVVLCANCHREWHHSMQI